MFSRSYCDSRGWHKNNVGVNRARKEAIIVAKRSADFKDWSLNEKAMVDAEHGEREGKIEQAYVALIDVNGAVVNIDTVQNVLRKLMGAEAINGPYGPYYWVDRNFEPTESSNPIDNRCTW
jgi:hypothetical protein